MARPALLGDVKTLRIRSQLHSTMPSVATVYVPNESYDSDYDSFTSYGPDISQPKASATDWDKSVIRCRVTHVRANNEYQGAYKGLAYTPKPGDVLLSAKLSDKGVFDKAHTTRNGYVMIDNIKYTITQVAINQVEGKTTTLVACQPA